MRILIVEDEVTLNKTIAEGLQEFGYQTDSSENFKTLSTTSASETMT